MKRVLLALTLVVVGARLASAQPLPGGSITVAGANCSVVQRCVDVDVTGLPSIGIYLNVATSGTFVHEASLDATDVSSGTWFAINDDAGNANTTADAAIFFTNPGYKRIRLRASAINGTATVTVYQGAIGMRSTATLSGGGDASAANQTTEITHLSAIETAVEGTLVVGDGSGALNVICDSGCSGGTQYAEDAVHGSGNTGTLALVVRNDAGTPLAADGDNIPLMVNSAGALYVAGTVTATNLDVQIGGSDTVAVAGAATPADNFANPTTAITVWSLNGCFDGSAWDRCPTSTGGSGTIDANTARVNIATDDPVNDSLVNLDVALNADEGAFTYTTTQTLAAGFVAESTTDTLADGTVGAAVMTLSRFLRTTPSGYSTGGGVPVVMLSDNTDNDDETAICTGPCTVYSIIATNHAAAQAYLRCENDTAANTTPGSETRSDGEFDIEIPGNTAGAGYAISFPVGVSYATALTCWLATGEASSDATDPGQDDVRVVFSRVQ